MVKLSPYCKLIYCSKNHLQCASIHFALTKYINLKLSNVLSFIGSTTVYLYKSTDWYYLFCKCCKCDKNTIQNSYTVSYDSSATNDLIRLGTEKWLGISMRFQRLLKRTERQSEELNVSCQIVSFLGQQFSGGCFKTLPALDSSADSSFETRLHY